MATEDFYGRKSTLDDGRSVASQEDEWRSDCGERGVTPGLVFLDPDLSASRFARKHRPDYAQLLEHVTSGRCEQLGLWESSRGTRRPGEWFDFLDLCRQRAVLIRIVSHQRTYDMRIRRDWRTLADEGVEAADESEKLSERVRRGQKASAVKGLPAGKLPFGFVREYDERGRFVRQVPHPEQAPVVAEIVGWAADKVPMVEIARRLNGRGVATPSGTLWSGTRVRQLVLSPTLIGRRVHRGKEIGEAVWPAIVDEVLWRRAVAELTRPDRRTQRGTEMRWWLAGAARCGLCGGVLRPEGARGFYSCRSCRRVRITAAHLEAEVETLLLDRLRPEGAALAPMRDDAELRAAVDAERDLREQLDGHYLEAAAKRLSPGGLSRMEALLLPQIAAAEAKRKRLERPAALAEFAGVDLVAGWPGLSARQRRTVVMAYADLVVGPAVRRGGFDPARLGGSRWVGEAVTWGEKWGLTAG